MSRSLGARLLISEIFPNRMRAVAMGYVLLPVDFELHRYSELPDDEPQSCINGAFPWGIPLLLCSGFSIIAFWFVGRFLPETKGVSLEHIEPLMLSKSRRFGGEQEMLVTPKSVSQK